MTSNYDLRTLTVHAGLKPDPSTGAIAPNIVASSNYTFKPEGVAFSANLNPDLTEMPFFYSRWTNPTVRQLEERMCALESAEAAIATASGMGAVSVLFFGLLKAGDHVIVSDVCYPGVRELCTDILTDLNITCTAVNLSNLSAVREALRPNTRFIHAESPCNPLLRLTDIAGLAAIAREAGVLLSVDSTVATPVATQPIMLGAHIVVHSLTKFINGHGDALGGIICGPKVVIEPIRSKVAIRIGATLSPQSAWLILRGIDSLFARMDMISRNAQHVAESLEKHPLVARVIYPGLASHPQRELAVRQMQNFSGMMIFQVKHNPEGVASAMAADNGLKLVHFAVSLGHQRSNIVMMRTDELMRSTYHLEGSALEEYKSYAGDAIFRLSVGLEASKDIVADLFAVLDRFV